MDNTSFVAERMAALDPPADWSPDTAAALRRHHARLNERWRSGPGIWWKLAMAAAVLSAIFVLPPTRGLAQRLWHYLTVTRVEVPRIDFSLLPDNSSLRADLIRRPGDPVLADSIEAARIAAGYSPRLPASGTLNGTPKLTVLASMAYGTVLKTQDLRDLLDKSGIQGETIPPEWEGARLVLETSAIVQAEWQDTKLMQALPMKLATPEGFDLRAFTTLVLRGLRVPRVEAERLAGRMDSTPALMLPISNDEHAGIRDVQLRSGPATMLIDYDENHPGRIERTALIWSVSDRIYLLSSSMDENIVIAIANSIQ